MFDLSSKIVVIPFLYKLCLFARSQTVGQNLSYKRQESLSVRENHFSVKNMPILLGSDALGISFLALIRFVLCSALCLVSISLSIYK